MQTDVSLEWASTSVGASKRAIRGAARPGPYLLYAGRIEEGKRVDVAVEYALRYASERPNPPQLVLIGRGSYDPPEDAAEVVVDAGFVSPEERRAAYAEAVALVNPVASREPPRSS